ncbi:draxin [Anolis carolinensis]|uniref:draxin n=1 Tax=Anolis carolinensis TaxID=28377 RepID=UPI002F2B40B4
MAADLFSASAAVVLCLLTFAPADSSNPESVAVSGLPEVSNAFPDQEDWALRGARQRQHHRHQGEHGMSRPAGLRQKEAFLGFGFPSAGGENHGPGAERAGRAHREQRRHGRRDRTGPHTGTPSALYRRPWEAEEERLQASPLEGSSGGSAPPSGPPPKATSPRPKARPRSGEVLPTLDMALFDWTDYEDLRSEMWSSGGKRGLGRQKPGGNETHGEPCDHHLDCLPGCCCDLREHLCKPHNRGLNNKCYGDCMCTEGLRCFAKFHRNRRVMRRKGRCLDPGSADPDRGSFMAT